jgi:hypothetical protein
LHALWHPHSPDHLWSPFFALLSALPTQKRLNPKHKNAMAIR